MQRGLISTMQKRGDACRGQQLTFRCCIAVSSVAWGCFEQRKAWLAESFQEVHVPTVFTAEEVPLEFPSFGSYVFVCHYRPPIEWIFFGLHVNVTSCTLRVRQICKERCWRVHTSTASFCWATNGERICLRREGWGSAEVECFNFNSAASFRYGRLGWMLQDEAWVGTCSVRSSKDSLSNGHKEEHFHGLQNIVVWALYSVAPICILIKMVTVLLKNWGQYELILSFRILYIVQLWKHPDVW